MQVPRTDSHGVADHALLDQLIDLLRRDQPHSDVFTVVLVPFAIRGAAAGDDQLYAVRLDRGIGVELYEQLRRRRTVAGLFFQLAQRRPHRVLTVLDDARRKLERHALHRMPELLDEHDPAVLRKGNHLDATRHVEHVKLVHLTRTRRPRARPPHLKNIELTHNLRAYSLPLLSHYCRSRIMPFHQRTRTRTRTRTRLLICSNSHNPFQASRQNNDLPKLLTRLEPLMCLAYAFQRHGHVDDGVQLAIEDELHDSGELAPVGHGSADDLELFPEQQAAIRLEARTGGSTIYDDAAESRGRAHVLRPRRLADGIEDDIDAALVGVGPDLLRVVASIALVNDVGAEGAHALHIVGGGDRVDARAGVPRDLDGGGGHAAGRAGDEDGLSGDKARAGHESA